MSKIAVAVKHMLASGVPHDTIVAAVEEMEGTEPELTKRQARNKRYYENHKPSEKRLNKTNSDVSDDQDAGEQRKVSPTPPSKETIYPPSPPTGDIPPQPKRARQTGIKPDWKPKLGTLDALRAEGHSSEAIERAVREMIDWGISNAKRKADWDAALRNWVRRNAPRARGSPEEKHPLMAACDRLQERRKRLNEQSNPDDGKIIDLEAGRDFGARPRTFGNL